MSQLSKPEIDFFEGPAPTELVITDLVVGDGAEATPGATVDVHYVGVEFDTGEEFDASWNRGASINFPLGSLIAGWQQGIPGMKVNLDVTAGGQVTLQKRHAEGDFDMSYYCFIHEGDPGTI